MGAQTSVSEVLRQPHTHALFFVFFSINTAIWCYSPFVEAERLVRHTQLGMSLVHNSSSSCCTAPRLRGSKNTSYRLLTRSRFTSEKHENTSTSRGASMTAADLLESLKAEAAFAQQLQDPGFKFVVDSHLMLHDIVTRAVPLQAARTKVSDAQGVFMRHAQPNSKTPDAQPTQSPLLRIQTLQPLIQKPSTTSKGSNADSSARSAASSASHASVDWAHHTFALSPFYCYSKSSVFTADSSLMPHLELEMGVTPGKEQVLLYVNMDPRLSPTLSPAYLNHYYLQAPPTNSSSSSSSSGGSWGDVEARAAGSPGFHRFTSPDLHVRVFSSTSILFQVDKEGWAAAKEVLSDAVSIWTAWATSDHAFVDTPPAAMGAGGQQAHTLPEDVSARSWAWRRFPRRERQAGMMKSMFGEQAMEDYWDSMAGEARIRLQ